LADDMPDRLVTVNAAAASSVDSFSMMKSLSS
jgi:hypothetical protein